MNNIPVVKLGLIAVSRDCFPIQLSEKRRAAIKETYKGELYECPVTVENEKDMEKALEDVNKAECNALVVFLGNFGPETPETLIAERFDGPCMYVAAAEGDGDMINGSTLAEVGIEGVEIQDKQPLTEEDKAQMFVDIMPEGPADDGVAYLNFYLEEDADKEAILKDVREALDDLKNFMDIGEATIEESQTEDKDWINNWKQYFHQFYVDDILIVPSWEEVKAEDKDKMILHIDPGTAFGTGMHETTQLVIRQLKKYVTPDTEMLDVGTGSGILGIVALKLGAKHVLGTDLDPCAVPAVAENKEANQIVDETFDMVIGNIIDDKAIQDQAGYEKYDIVTANILADVLIPLTPVIVNQMKKGAYYITSGILDVKEEVVVEAVKAAGLTVVEVTHQGEWVSVTARKD